MDTSGYRIDGACTAVALVNGVTTSGGLRDAGLSELLAAHSYVVGRLSTAEAEGLRDWAPSSADELIRIGSGFIESVCAA
jgi:hypothetical protein